MGLVDAFRTKDMTPYSMMMNVIGSSRYDAVTV